MLCEDCNGGSQGIVMSPCDKKLHRLLGYLELDNILLYFCQLAMSNMTLNRT